MTAQLYQNQIYQFISNFHSCSLVNADGALLASSDKGLFPLTTSRLVAFQIVKKYLNPKPLDLFIMNDPENGGYNLSQVIFITAIDSQLFLVWNETLPLVDFKIPPTPLYEKSRKNEFVWKALVENNAHSEKLKDFFEKEKSRVDHICTHSETIKSLSAVKNQNLWLKASQEVFDEQFTNKAHGNAESQHRIQQQLIKLKFLAEERQNIKLITLDFTSTSPATTYHAASHVVESALIQKIIQFYQVEKFLTQSILDKIKIILPPKSVVSKAHPTGEFNIEIQSICAQLCAHNIQQLNSQVRKSTQSFEIDSQFLIGLIGRDKDYSFHFNQKNIHLPHFETLIQDKKIELIKMQKTDQAFNLQFKALGDHLQFIKVSAQLGCAKQGDLIKVNDQLLSSNLQAIKKDDVISIKWSF